MLACATWPSAQNPDQIASESMSELTAQSRVMQLRNCPPHHMRPLWTSHVAHAPPTRHNTLSAAKQTNGGWASELSPGWDPQTNPESANLETMQHCCTATVLRDRWGKRNPMVVASFLSLWQQNTMFCNFFPHQTSLDFAGVSICAPPKHCARHRSTSTASWILHSPPRHAPPTCCNCTHTNATNQW